MIIEYKSNTASIKSIHEHLHKCSSLFNPPLDTYVIIEEYAKKLIQKSISFEAWDGNILVGLAAAYFNDYINKSGFLTNLSILNEYQNQGIASKLTAFVIEYGVNNGFDSINLEVKSINDKVNKFYERQGFVKTGHNRDCFIMTYYLKI